MQELVNGLNFSLIPRNEGRKRDPKLKNALLLKYCSVNQQAIIFSGANTTVLYKYSVISA